ncbi:3-isopropylmalate dehydratase small subunit [Bradyrhizobium sp. LA6.12]|uniref:3-isopropylmalate dehydratase small subunit n=1 Tax=unclassified Bradyrhizobium TaxID=2631580 RepID=UPI003395C90E
MQPFTRTQGIAAPLLRDNIDTDTIIRVERLFNAVPRADLGQYCMESLRYLPDGLPDPDFFRNDARYHGASILLCGRNFGCGSAREGAVWALAGMGIRCVIAPSVADLFAANCFQNGILAFTLDQTLVESLAAAVATDPANRQLVVDLQGCQVGLADGEPVSFSVPARRREALLEGFDEIDLTLKNQAKIETYRHRDRELRPWIYATDA